MVIVNAARSDLPMPRARAADRAAQQREQERVVSAKEMKLRRWERQEQHNEEYRLREQQGLSPSPALANSSSDEEESDGERTTSHRWEPAPPIATGRGSGHGIGPQGGHRTAHRRAIRAGASRCHGGAGGRSGGTTPALKEEEAGILQFVVSSASPRAPSISRGSCSHFLFFC
jgi:hypothetical protein